MNNKLFCNPAPRPRASNRQLLMVVLGILVCALVLVPRAAAGDAPDWMRALVNASLPAHDEKTDAVLLYSEENVNVVSPDKIREQVRVAYKILRPDGREYGIVRVPFNSHKKITRLRGWCIPAQGSIYEVKDKDAVEASPPMIKGAELISDVKIKGIQIPAPDPGNIIGYEYEAEEQPLVLQRDWGFQQQIPVRESHFSLQLPSGWEYRALWLNYPEVKPNQAGGNQWQWAVSDVKAIRKEVDMPPVQGVAGQMIVSFFPPGGTGLQQLAADGELVSQLGERTSRCFTGDQADSDIADGFGKDASRQDAGTCAICSARYSLRSNRAGYRRLAATSGSGDICAPLRRLQGQSHADGLDAA